MPNDILLLFLLIVLNGVFAMSEIAIVSARRARLMQMAEAGRKGASHALTLASEPTRFLSSVQVGITSIGILNGAIGEGAIAARLRPTLEQVPVLAPYADTLSLAIMVGVLTYVSLIIGELVPKRLALIHPETIASAIARPMEIVAAVARPIVLLLSVSTDSILRLFRVRQAKQPGVTADEIRVMLEQGAEEGVFEPTEHELVTNVLNLDDRHVGAVLTRRSDIVYLDIRDSADTIREKMRDQTHSVLPLCDGGLDKVLGFVRSTKVMAQILETRQPDLSALGEPPLFVPETMTLMKLLEQFKRTHLPVALVVDEFGDVEGLVSFTDVISSIVGDLPTEPGEEPAIVQREDGSWLLDGAVDLDAALRTLGAEAIVSDEDRQHFHTLGGLAMVALGRVPRTGDVFERGDYRFEVVDMDGNRVDRILASRKTPPAEEA
ncbi:MAG TPA: hemolysin family protein [Vicinamibacterales bacterium]|nr:hemolysin family protein [Vicinamibacterales bacterium]